MKRVLKVIGMFVPARPFVLCLLPMMTLIAFLYAGIGGEDEVAAWFASHREGKGFLYLIMKYFSKYGNLGYYLLYGGMLVYGIVWKKCGVTVFVLSYAASLLVTLLAVDLLKFTVGRPRPLVEGGFEPFSSSRSNQSFPSGHVAETFTTILPFAHRFSRTAAIVFFGLSPMCMGLSRLYLGQHHLSDFAGSVVVSVVALALGRGVTLFLARRRHSVRLHVGGAHRLYCGGRLFLRKVRAWGASPISVDK